MKQSRLVYTKENCIGCNRCIGVCPCFGANIATVDQNGNNRIMVNSERCIGCGACINVCVHGARSYEDDTLSFFNDLAEGKEISILIDSSFEGEYPDENKKLLGQLKELGVKQIFPASFGTDIAAWAYIHFMTKKEFHGGILQSCPAGVDYIEKNLPELLPKLLPVHSPMMCSAVYVRKYLKNTDALAFISPCIAGEKEIEAVEGKGYIDYHVTFQNLVDYLGKRKVVAQEFIMESQWESGSVYPMPGGLKDKVKWFLGEEASIRQVDGEKSVFQYLSENREQLLKGQKEYVFLDTWNCSGECAGGKECGKKNKAGECFFSRSKQEKEVKKDSLGDSTWNASVCPEKHLHAWKQQFRTLELRDFLRTYSDRSEKAGYLLPSREEEEAIFLSLKKDISAKRVINCGGCGYENCKTMVTAIYNGFNQKENCVQYTREMAVELSGKLETELLARDYKNRHDTVTGLYNSAEFYSKVQEELEAHPDEKYYIVVIDVRQFKLVNDLYGYEYGNWVLITQAEQMRHSLTGVGIYGRISADRFGICFSESKYSEKRLLKEIDIFEKNVARIGIHVFLQVGVCMAENNSLSPFALVDRAFIAVRTIKSSYRQKIAYFCEDMRKKSIRAQRMVSEFEDALKEGQFQLFIQPQLSAVDERVIGGETLVRWIHPKKGVVSPGYFIPVFEECGLISVLDRFVWRQACMKLKEWKDRGFGEKYLSVNISPYDLHSLNIYEVMTGLVEEYEISPHNLKLEITETAVMSDLETQLVMIEKLKAYGFTVEMDDFGSGYSSLNMLKDINVNALKIDMKFLSKTENIEKSNMIIRTIIELSKQLGMNVITEGVETQEQVDFLKNTGSDIFQGYFFAKPMPVQEFEERYL